jgi:hypothetical protein
VKLTTLPPDELRALVAIGQDAFLCQLLDFGFFHGERPGGYCTTAWEGTAWMPALVDTVLCQLLDFGFFHWLHRARARALSSAELSDESPVSEFIPHPTFQHSPAPYPTPMVSPPPVVAVLARVQATLILATY